MHNEIADIFHQFYSPLCNYASKIVQNNVDAEDIVQSFFVQLYEKNNLVSIVDMEKYLLRCIKNKCIDYLRDHKISTSLELINEEIGNEHQEITEEDIEPLFYYYAAKLPPKTREVFLMSRVGQLTYKEIAEELNISQKTVENQMGSALKKLKTFLRDEQYLFLIFFP